jgi:hypothetical protein
VRLHRSPASDTHEGESATSRDLAVLNKKVRKVARRAIADHDSIRLVIPGESSQALVALQERLLIVKAGWSFLFDALATSFHYRDITDISITRGSVTSIVRLTARGSGPYSKEWWQGRDPARDPFAAPNCLPVRTSRLPELEADLATLRRLVENANALAGLAPPTAELEHPTAPAPDPVSLLERLAALHASGELSDDEYRLAKERILGTGEPSSPE